MKTFTINIPTKKNEVKDFFMYLFSWVTHAGRMKRNSKVMHELFKNLCDEINSGYWSNDISDCMKKELTDLYIKDPTDRIDRAIVNFLESEYYKQRVKS